MNSYILKLEKEDRSYDDLVKLLTDNNIRYDLLDLKSWWFLIYCNDDHYQLLKPNYHITLDGEDITTC